MRFFNISSIKYKLRDVREIADRETLWLGSQNIYAVASVPVEERQISSSLCKCHVLNDPLSPCSHFNNFKN